MPEAPRNTSSEFANRSTDPAPQGGLMDTEQLAAGDPQDEHPNGAEDAVKSRSLLSRVRSVDPHNRRSLFRR
jgi:hypothetical protein